MRAIAGLVFQRVFSEGSVREKVALESRVGSRDSRTRQFAFLHEEQSKCKYRQMVIVTFPFLENFFDNARSLYCSLVSWVLKCQIPMSCR